MIRIGNLRIGKGIAIINRKRFYVAGFGAQSFKDAIANEVSYG